MPEILSYRRVQKFIYPQKALKSALDKYSINAAKSNPAFSLFCRTPTNAQKLLTVPSFSIWVCISGNSFFPSCILYFINVCWGILSILSTPFYTFALFLTRGGRSKKKFFAFLERVRGAQPSPKATAGQGGEKNNEADVRLLFS